MDTPDTLAEPDTRTEQQKIEDWRETMLFDAGYPPTYAIELSRLPHVDVHQAAALLEHGCSLDTAVDILR